MDSFETNAYQSEDSDTDSVISGDDDAVFSIETALDDLATFVGCLTKLGFSLDRPAPDQAPDKSNPVRIPKRNLEDNKSFWNVPHPHHNIPHINIPDINIPDINIPHRHRRHRRHRDVPHGSQEHLSYNRHQEAMYSRNRKLELRKSVLSDEHLDTISSAQKLAKGE